MLTHMNSRLAILTMFWLLGAVTLFHLWIVLKIIPYEITWGGRLKNDTEMYVFESVSILINLFLCFILCIKGNYLTEIIPVKIVNSLLWAFLFLFSINTLGNLFAETFLEKSLSLLTLIFTYLIWVILRGSKKNTT